MIELIGDILNGTILTAIVGGVLQCFALYLTALVYAKTVHRDVQELLKTITSKFEVDYAF